MGSTDDRWKWDLVITHANRDQHAAQRLADALSDLRVLVGGTEAALRETPLVVVLVRQGEGGPAFDAELAARAVDVERATEGPRIAVVCLGDPTCLEALPVELRLRRAFVARSAEGLPSVAEGVAELVHARREPPPAEAGWTACIVHALHGTVDVHGREAELEAVLRWARDPDEHLRVLALAGSPGVGRTALSERVVAELARSPRAGGTFVWSFAEDQRAEEFFAEALGYFAGEARQERASGLRSRLQAVLAQGQPHLLVLDGLEVVQSTGVGNRPPGSLDDTSLRLFLLSVAGGWVGRTRVLLTCEESVAELAGWRGTAYRELRLGPLAPAAAARLLRARGVLGSEAELASLASRVAYHPLAVSLLAAWLVGHGDGKQGAASGLALPPAGEPIAADRALDAVLNMHLDALGAVERAVVTRLAALPRGITLEHLEVLATTEGVAGSLEGTDEAGLEAAVARLQQVGLIARKGRLGRVSVAIRPGVRAFFRARLDVSAEGLHRALRTDLASSLVLRPGAPPRDRVALDQVERLVELTRLSGQHREAFEIYLASMGGWDHLGEELSEFSRVDRMLSSLCQGGDPDRVSSELDWAEASQLLTELGLARAALGELQGAIRCHERAYELDDANNPDYRQRQLDRSVDFRYLALAHLLRGRLPMAEHYARASIAARMGSERVDAEQARDAKVVPLFQSVETVERPILVERRDPRVAAVTGDARVSWGAGRVPVLDPNRPDAPRPEHLAQLGRWTDLSWSRVAPRLRPVLEARFGPQLESLRRGSALSPGIWDQPAGVVITLMRFNGHPELVAAVDEAFGDSDTGAVLSELVQLDRRSRSLATTSYVFFAERLMLTADPDLLELVQILVAASEAVRSDADELVVGLVNKAALARVLPLYPEGLPGIGVVRHLDGIWSRADRVLRQVVLASCIDATVRRSGTPPSWPVPARVVPLDEQLEVMLNQPATPGALRVWSVLPEERRAPLVRHVEDLGAHDRSWLARFDVMAELRLSREADDVTEEQQPIVHRVRQAPPAPDLEEILGVALFLQGRVKDAESHFHVMRRAVWKGDRDREALSEGLGVHFSETRLLVGDRVSAREYAEFAVDLAGSGADANGRPGRQGELAHRGCLVIAHAQLEHRADTSRRLLEETRQWAVASGHVELTVRCHLLSAALALREGDAAQASGEAAQGRDLAQSCGFDLLVVDCACLLARAQLALQRAEEARETAEGAVRIASAETCAYAWGRAEALHLAGVAAAGGGDAQAALTLLTEACQAREAVGHPGLEETRRHLAIL